MLERKTVSQCVDASYCAGWNDAVEEAKGMIDKLKRERDQATNDLMLLGTNVRCATCMHEQLRVFAHEEPCATCRANGIGSCWHWRGDHPEIVWGID